MRVWEREQREKAKGEKEKREGSEARTRPIRGVCFFGLFSFCPENRGTPTVRLTPRRVLAFGSPTSRQLLSSLSHRLFPPRPPSVCVRVFTVCFTRLSRKRKFSFFEFFLLKSPSLRLALLRSLDFAFGLSHSLMFRSSALASARDGELSQESYALALQEVLCQDSDL